MKYKSKVVEIEAFQFMPNAHDFGTVPNWFKKELARIDWNKLVWFHTDSSGYRRLSVKTLNGLVSVNAGDFIIKASDEELYPCPEKVFLKKYEVGGE